MIRTPLTVSNADTSFSLHNEWVERLNRLSTRFYHVANNNNAAGDAIIDEILPDNEFIIGEGSGRRVIELPVNAYSGGAYYTYVIKFGLKHKYSVALDGRVQNAHEMRVWSRDTNMINMNDFVPVIKANPDYFWVIMPRGESLTTSDVETDAYQSFCDRAIDKYAGRVLDKDDVRKPNIVKLDGTFKLCDYGCVNGDI